MRHFKACLGASAIALASIAAPAYAADDIGSNPVTELFEGLGLSAKEKPDIDYQDRAALVPPPSTANLPAPQEPGAAGRATGQWPNDPDVQARAERRARANVVPTETNSYRMGERGSRLDPDEIGARRVRGASIPQTAGDSTRGDNEISRMSPQELGSQRINRGAMQPTSGERSKLSDPPPGYLAGSSGVTAQVEPEKKGFFKRMFGN